MVAMAAMAEGRGRTMRRTLQGVGVLVLGSAAVLAAGWAGAQERYSPFVGSAHENVARMVSLAALKPGDVVADLGSGDGRVVIAAAQANPGVRGWGVDLDPKLVSESNAAARAAGLAGRVQFHRRNAFDADLRKVDVVFMWLWTEVQRMLRTKILAEARPGTRIVTNLWDLGSWEPDEVDDSPATGPVRLWIVPARIAGNWSWEFTLRGRGQAYAAVLEQTFQKAEGVVRTGNRRGIVHDLRLRGEDISFTISMTMDGLGYVSQRYAGRVQGARMEGRVSMLLADKPGGEDFRAVELPWRAVRTKTSAYFAPTGLDMH